ncbi:MAG: bifunctional heptose 7-phosphate kinase/heptose 1-phosphate adenyltransferase [Phycisphaerales bacterium]|nr:bifunctional heptose 7-phosphate kinase/heptose 1-phosphate adenyltransferase [Phycisphaerales bacterium]
MPSHEDRLLAHLAKWSRFKLLVVGDFMLDQMVMGAAERLSPDAPVPVLRVQSVHDVQETPGGASNVAVCAAALGGEVRCIGVTGNDAASTGLRAALALAGCDASMLIVDPSRPTTVKRSLVGLAQHRHPQKMFRLDFESQEPLSAAIEAQLLAAVERELAWCDVVALEDYNKGVCSAHCCAELMRMARAAGKRVLVDPAAIECYAKYSGAFLVTPNRTEAELATGMDTPLDASVPHNKLLAEKILETCALDAVVLTLDRHGALLLEKGGEVVTVPTVARAIYDVTGAGDMVLAALAAAIANGIPLPEAVAFANHAAGLEVEVFGVQPIPFAMIRQSVLARTTRADGRVRRLEDLSIELDVHRASGKRIVLTNGNFDVLHAGHVAYLREAKALGDVLVVGVNSDAQVRAQKGPMRPIFQESERLEMLSECRSIDYLVVFEEPTAHELIRAVRPDFYVKGGDYKPAEIAEFALVEALGICLKTLAHREGLGSRVVIERLQVAERAENSARLGV